MIAIIGRCMTNEIPEITSEPDGYYWEDSRTSNGPFPTADAALNDYVDSHPCEEE